MTAYVSHLRVYEPLAAFDEAQRRQWEAYLRAGGAPSRGEGPELERTASLRAMAAAVPATLPALPEHAFLADVDGVTLVCPWRSTLRCAEALADFRDGLPDEVADGFVPRSLVDTAEEVVEHWREEQPHLRSHILSSCWQVPLRWFVLVDADEREVRLGGVGVAPARTGRELLYRTPMSRARRRVARALAVLRRAVDDGAVTTGVEDLGRWLEEFHPRSMVELDYGGLVYLLDDAELRQDDSARDISEALSALADGAPARAAAAYSRVTARMKALQGVEASN